MSDSTTDQSSALDDGLLGAAEAFQDQLTPRRKRADTEEDREAQQDDEPTDNVDDAEDEADEPKGKKAKTDDDKDDQGEESEEGDGEEPDPESDEPDAEGEEVDLTQAFTVETPDGTEEVKLGELVKGYLRQKDYTRKTQAVAEERRVAQAERQETAQLRAQFMQGLEQLREAITYATPQEPDWDALKARDPILYAEEWADWQRRQHVIGQIEAERQAVAEQHARELEAHRRETLRKGFQWLVQQVPEWSDEGKYRADRAEIRAFAQKAGYSAEELQQVDDPRAILLLRQAMLYSKLQEKKAVLIKPKAKAPTAAGTKTPVMKPQAAKQTQSVKTQRLMDARKRHAKEQSVESAAAIFESFI